MAKIDPPSNSSSNFAHKNINITTLNTFTIDDYELWVINSGQNDHINRFFKYFFNLIFLPRVKIITYGSLCFVSGKGLVQCTHTLSLSSILFFFFIFLIICCLLIK